MKKILLTSIVGLMALVPNMAEAYDGPSVVNYEAIKEAVYKISDAECLSKTIAKLSSVSKENRPMGLYLSELATMKTFACTKAEWGAFLANTVRLHNQLLDNGKLGDLADLIKPLDSSERKYTSDGKYYLAGFDGNWFESVKEWGRKGYSSVGVFDASDDKPICVFIDSELCAESRDAEKVFYFHGYNFGAMMNSGHYTEDVAYFDELVFSKAYYPGDEQLMKDNSNFDEMGLSKVYNPTRYRVKVDSVKEFSNLKYVLKDSIVYRRFEKYLNGLGDPKFINSFNYEHLVKDNEYYRTIINFEQCVANMSTHKFANTQTRTLRSAESKVRDALDEECLPDSVSIDAITRVTCTGNCNMTGDDKLKCQIGYAEKTFVFDDLCD